MKPELDCQERQDCIDALRLQADAGPAVEDSWQHRYRVLADKLTKSDKDVPRRLEQPASAPPGQTVQTSFPAEGGTSRDLDLDAIEARAKAAYPIYRGLSLFDDNCGDEFPDAHGAWVTRDYARRLAASANDVPALIAALREARTAINAFRNCCGNALEVCVSCNAAFAALGYTLPSEENPNA